MRSWSVVGITGDFLDRVSIFCLPRQKDTHDGQSPTHRPGSQPGYRYRVL